MSKKVDAKRNLDEIRADIDNDPEITEEERAILRSFITGMGGLAEHKQVKKPNILRRIFRKII